MDKNSIDLKLKSQWQQIKEYIRSEYEIKDIAYKIWIEPLKYYRCLNNTISIIVPNNSTEMINYISKKYKSCFQATISEMFGTMFEIEFIEADDNISKEDETLLSDDREINSTYYKDEISKKMSEANLNSKYKFETFVVGSNNNMAHSACLAVAESPGKDFNPLFIYGGSGLGKTHLMNSIGHYILENNRNMKVLYVTSETFTNEVIESIRQGNSNGNTSAMTKLREKYRNIDVLLIDDIQFIIGKVATQEEFFHTFNTLRDAGKAIVISSDKHPKEMTTLEERLRSRFEWGLCVDIQPPVYETRVAILQKYAETYDYEIPNDVINYIANNIKSNVRELEGALNKVIASYKLKSNFNADIQIDMTLAQEALKDTISSDKPTIITPNLILEVVANYYNIDPDDISSKKRNAEFVMPRHIFMFLCRDMTDITLKQIAVLLERDHSTILHGVNKIENEIRKNREMKDTIEILKKKIKNEN